MPTANYENKDKRIAFLALHRDAVSQGLKGKKAEDQAYQEVERLYKKYPFPYIGIKEQAVKSEHEQTKAEEVGEEIKEQEEKEKLEIPIVEEEE